MDQPATSNVPPRTTPATRRPRALADVPGPRGLPLLGNLLQVDTARFHLSLEEMWRAHGDLFSFRLGPKHCLGVADPALVRSIMRERPHDFTRMSTMESTARELGMHGVFSAEGEDWKRQRTLIMPAFRDSHLLQRFDTLRAITERLMSSLAPHAARGEPVLILDPFMRYTVDVMAQVSLGEDLNTLERGSAGTRRLTWSGNTARRALLSPIQKLTGLPPLAAALKKGAATTKHAQRGASPQEPHE